MPQIPALVARRIEAAPGATPEIGVLQLVFAVEDDPALASVAWFTAIGLGSRLLGSTMARPRTRWLLDAFIAATMTATALRQLAAT